MYTTSATLLEQIRRRSGRDAWERFVQLYTPFLLHCGRRLGLADADAADVVQDVFLVLFEKLPTFEYSRDGSFRGWLRTVTMHKCFERQRKRREAAIGGSDARLFDQLQQDDSDAWWEAEYRQHLVARALEIMQAEFEPTTWQACWRTTVDDLTAADVANDLGITVNAVYVARSRVLRRLRNELDGLLEE